MKHHVTLLASVILSLSCAPLSWSQLPALEFSRGRQGDAWVASINGRAGAPGFLGLDFTPGPTMTAVGTLGVGMSSDFVLVPFMTDMTGSASVHELALLDPATVGMSVYGQAGIQNLSAPFGVELSNPESSTLRGPRCFVSQAVTVFGTPQFTQIDAMELGRIGPTWTRVLSGAGGGDSMVFSAKYNMLMTYRVIQMSFGLVAGEIEALDGDTGASLFSISLPTSSIGRVEMSQDEDEILATNGSRLLRILLPSGSSSVVFVAPQLIRDFVEIESSSNRKGYIAAGNSVYPIDLTTNILGPAVLTNSINGTFLSAHSVGDRLITTYTASAPVSTIGLEVHVLDTVTDLPISGSPVNLGTLSSARPGVASVDRANAFPSYAILSSNLSTFWSLEEGPLRATNSISGLGFGPNGLTSSPEGNYWFLGVSTGTLAVDTTSLVTTPLNAQLGGHTRPGRLAAIRSQTLDGVFNVVPLSNTDLETFFIPTNPLTSPVSLGTLPRPPQSTVRGILGDG